MLPEIHTDQMALAAWIGQIDTTDAMLISLIRSLDPNNPRVSALMTGGYFLFTTSFVLEQLPLINIKDDMLGLHLKKLKKLGLINKIVRFSKKTGHALRYVKLSKRYYAAEERGRGIADRALYRARPVATRQYARTHSGRLTDSIREDHNKVITSSGASSSLASVTEIEPSAAVGGGGSLSGFAQAKESEQGRQPAMMDRSLPWRTQEEYDAWEKERAEALRGRKAAPQNDVAVVYDNEVPF